MRASAKSSSGQYAQTGDYMNSLLHSAILQVTNQLVHDTHDMTSLHIVFAVRHLSWWERAARG